MSVLSVEKLVKRFVGPDGRPLAAVDELSFELPEEKLSGFLAFVNPKRVILLGGTEVIPPKYRLAIGSKTERAEIEDLNWNINAIILGNLLMDREMQKKFREAIRNRAAEALHAPDTGK